MKGISDLKKKLSEFQRGSDYSFSVENQEEIYIISSEKLKNSLREILSHRGEWQGRVRVSSKIKPGGISEGVYEIAQGDEIATYYKKNEGSDEFRLIGGQVVSPTPQMEKTFDKVSSIFDKVDGISKKVGKTVDEISNLPDGFFSRQGETENSFSRENIDVWRSNDNNSPQIQEITDQEAQQIENQQRPFFPKPKGNF